MSQKSKSKSKSKSKQKVDKPPKDSKTKKSKQDKGDAKSKKSESKVSKKSSKKQPIPQPNNPALDLSQQNFSDFLKNPFMFPQPHQSDSALCIHHKQPNSIFCEICEQTGCESCLLYGPHNNQMHRIQKLDQAFQGRYMYLNEIVCNQLIQKRQKLTKYIEELTVLSDELRFVKNGIQKTTKIEYNEMMERLRISSGSKLAILHHEMAELQKDLQSINSLGNEFFELTNLNPIASSPSETIPNKGIVPFLLRSKFLQEEAEQLISKPIKATVDVYPYDLPRQLTQRKMIIDKNRSWIDLLKLKDQSLWNLTQEKKGLRNKVLETFNQQAQVEISQWSKLKEKIEMELQNVEMKCQKCQQGISEDIVNEQCGQGGYHHFVR